MSLSLYATMFQLCCTRYTFFLKNVQNVLFFLKMFLTYPPWISRP